MEKKELEEIQQKEFEQAFKNVKYMLKKKKLSDIWLLYKDKFDFIKQKVTCPALTSTISIPLLIPISEKVLAPIGPIQSQEKFEEKYEFSVNDLLEWRSPRKGWCETILMAPPPHFTGLDYLDKLIEVSPSASIRSEVYLAYIASLTEEIDGLNSIADKGKKIFRGRLEVDPCFIDAFGEEKGKNVLESVVVTDYIELSALGFKDIIEVVELFASQGKMERAAFLTRKLSDLLATPFLYSLRKTTVYSFEEKFFVEKLCELLAGKTKAESLFLTPPLLADVYDTLGITVSGILDADGIRAVRDNSVDFIKAVKNLDEEIDKTVKEKFEGGVLDKNEEEEITAKKEDLRYRWEYEIKPAFESIEKRRKRINRMMMTGSIVAPLGTLLALQPIVTIPAAYAAIKAKDKIEEIIDPVAEYLSLWWDHNPIHIGFYKVEKEIERLKR